MNQAAVPSGPGRREMPRDVRAARPHVARGGDNRSLRARLLAVVVALMGLLNVASSAFFPITSRLRWLRQVLPPEITLGSRTLTLVAGFFLMGVAWNLAQRKRVAWLLTVWLLLVSAFSHVLKGLDVEEAAIALLLLSILWWFRRDFSVRSDPDAIQAILFATPYVLVFFFAYGVLGFYLLQRQFRPSFDLGSSIAEVVNLATFQGDQLFQPVSRQARWFVESLPLMSGIGVLFLVYNLTRPVLRPTPPTRRDRHVARSIAQDFGSSGIAYFALSPEKNYFFNEDATCVIAYVLVGGVALGAGDVIGPEEDLASTVEQFHRFCEENNWVPALFQVREEYLAHYRAAGLEALKIGEEALIDIRGFDLSGRSKDDLRAAVNRARREGWRFLFFDGPLGDEPLELQLQSISEAWLTDRIGGEMGFTMGGTSIRGSAETLVTCATAQEGSLFAFLTWAPMFARRGWSLDLMRRSNSAPNGTIEFLILQTLERLRERGDQVVSLGLAPLANTSGPSSEAVRSLDRAIELIYNRFDTIYGFKSLHQFKQKFGPRWENRYLVFPGLPALPRVVYALINAQMPSFSLGELTKLVRPAERPPGGSG